MLSSMPRVEFIARTESGNRGGDNIGFSGQKAAIKVPDETLVRQQSARLT